MIWSSVTLIFGFRGVKWMMTSLLQEIRMKNKIARYETDEGFEEPHIQSQVILDLPIHPLASHSIPMKVERKHRSYNRKQEPKLKFVSIDRDHSVLSHYQHSNSQRDHSIVNKSMTLNRQVRQENSLIKRRSTHIAPSNVKGLNFQSFKTALVRPVRAEIGQNLQLKDFDLEKKQQIKQLAMKKGNQIVFEEERQANSHGYFKRLLKLRDADSFLKSKYNKAIFSKIMDSCIVPKGETAKLSKNKEHVQFNSDFECANLDFATKVNHYEYDIYLKADTNSLGHQNWFYFKLFHNRDSKSSIFLNVCNLKRGFRMVKRGQKPYFRYRKLSTLLETGIEELGWSDWEHVQGEVSVGINPELSKTYANGGRKRVYKLCFCMDLIPEAEYEFSLLPPFSYSQMLSEISTLEQQCPNMLVQILGYSLIGLAIPIVTFTSKQSESRNKNVVLISSRIHPGQTCGSFVASGILQKLAQMDDEVKSLLQKNIIKIIPMINPDGVVLGNFRTNYLGSDLNRSFNRNDETLFPQVTALKTYGDKLSKQFKERFICFLDLHGHSSQKNIFTYGPQFQSSHKHFLSSRFLPKVLDHLSDEFEYQSCTFKLQQSKTSTARGFYLSQLKVMAFTVESSYALYDSKKQSKQRNLPLKPSNWKTFGVNIIESIQVWSQNFTSQAGGQGSKKKNLQQELDKCKDSIQKKKIQTLNFINKIKKQLRKQAILPSKKIRSKTQSDSDGDNSEDSDGQSESQDLSMKQRIKLEKKIIQGSSRSLFPRILRPAIVHPQVNPPLFTINKISPESKGPKGNNSNNNSMDRRSSNVNMKMKRQRYNTIKPMNVNSAYTEYLIKEVKGLESLRPSVNLMKLERKDSIFMQQSQQNVSLLP